ncbi:MAG: PilZ domain-containing protein [Candidatus Omnitrophica bacterium]|nr:PilZ domain-containing protein [Candidatus Omnitrophota bacterium]
MKAKVQEKSGAERRLAIRADRVIAIKHRLIKRQSKKADAFWSLSTTKNMSITGILFLSDTEYKAGDILEVSVVMSGIIDIVNGPAQVVRVAENGDTSYDVAVKFIEMKPPARSAKSHLK